MVIDSMFVYYFLDPGLRVEIFLEKKRAVENGGVDFEIGDISTSAHLYWRLKENFMYNLCAFYYFFGGKRITFKSSLDLCFHPFIFEFF